MPENNFKKADKYIFSTGFDVILDGDVMFSDSTSVILDDKNYKYAIFKYSVKQRVNSILKELPFIKPEDILIVPAIKILDLEKGRIL